MSIKVVVNGALGKMGKEVVKAVQADNDLKLVGVVDAKDIPASYIAEDVVKGTNLEEVLKNSAAEVMVDFTQPDVVMNNIKTALNNGISPVVGTTGLSDEDLDEIHLVSEKNGKGTLIAPNFSIGAVLMMYYAAKISKHMDNIEIIEKHHDKKIDAPSGTAIKTAQLIEKETTSHDSEDPARGSIHNGIHVHSLRLPGLVAHQEVIFGEQGQTLSIKHDTTSREAFMPGVVMAVKEIINMKGVTYGLENLLDL